MFRHATFYDTEIYIVVQVHKFILVWQKRPAGTHMRTYVGFLVIIGYLTTNTQIKPPKKLDLRWIFTSYFNDLKCNNPQDCKID